MNHEAEIWAWKLKFAFGSLLRDLRLRPLSWLKALRLGFNEEDEEEGEISPYVKTWVSALKGRQKRKEKGRKEGKKKVMLDRRKGGRKEGIRCFPKWEESNSSLHNL